MVSRETNMKFSVIVPTRNRQYTALHAIKSCTLSRYDNIEIIVTDCSDDDSLRNQVKNLNDNRVKYFFHAENLSMKENWEFGVSQAMGDYVCVIGDDDALMPDGLVLAYELLKIDPAPVLHCNAPTYKWPDYTLLNRQNYISLRLPTTVIKVRAPKDKLLQYYEFEHSSGTGPGIYHGLVSKKFLDMLKKKRGAFFVDPIVDFDSGYCTLLYADYYLRTTYPIFVSGHCGASNTGAMHTRARNSEAFLRFANEASRDIDYLLTSDLSKILTNSAVIIAAMIRFLPEANKVLKKKKIKLNKQKIFDLISKSVREGYESTTFKAEVAILQNLAKKWRVSPKEIPSSKPLPVGLIKDKGCTKNSIAEVKSVKNLVIDCDKLDVKDIQGAIKIIDGATVDWEVMLNFLGHKEGITTENRRFQGANLEVITEKLNQDKVEEAVDLLEKNIKGDFADDASLLFLGSVYFNQKRFHEAIFPLARSLSFKFTIEAFDAYFHSLINCNLLDFARQVLTNYTDELNNVNKQLLDHCLGIIEMKSGNYEFAAKIFDEVKPPIDPSLYYYCSAQEKFLSGMAIDAERLVKKALEYNNTKPEYLSLKEEIKAYS